ncbi:MAG: saccharopine dehydrogenase C-terminal domain-containing protein [Candidatus Aminicenantes bacterium]
MNKNVLVLGAGSVAPPLIKYLQHQSNIKLTIADQIFNKAKNLSAKSSHTQAVHLDIRNKKKTRDLISKANIVISILPHTFHPEIAKHCLELNTNMITASYVSESMQKFHSEAKQKGILLLNEIGLDPGIDHMEALRIINQIKKKRGTVLSFISYCGGLPAPEANTNPFGYKFSWSPRGVLLAGKNPAQYLKSHKKTFIPAEKLFQDPTLIHIPEVGDLEGYPNRNSLPYIDLYQIQDTQTLMRGTLRYKGWCSFMHQALKTGLLGEESKYWGEINKIDFLRKITGLAAKHDIKTDLASYLDIKRDSVFIQCMDWLGFFKKQPLPLKKSSPLDILVNLMEKKLSYQKGERDMIILQHRITAEYENRHIQEIISTLVDYGNPDGDTAMARTVGLPLAIAAKNILNGKIRITGVQIPVSQEIYEPILGELKNSGIEFKTNSGVK